MLHVKRTMGLSGYQRASLPRHAESRGQIQALGLHEETAHAGQVGKGDVFTGRYSPATAIRENVGFLLARADRLAEVGQAIRILQVGEEAIARAGGLDVGEFEADDEVAAVVLVPFE